MLDANLHLCLSPNNYKKASLQCVLLCCVSHIVLGPLQSVMQDLHSDDNDEDSEDDDDNHMDSDVERPTHTHLTHHQRRLAHGNSRLSLSNDLYSLFYETAVRHRQTLTGHRSCRILTVLLQLFGLLGSRSVIFCITT